MPGLTIVFGLLLVLVGVAGYVATGAATSLIPAFVGLLMLVLGGVARSSPGARKHAMHAAAGVGLLGFLAAVGRLGMSLARGTPPTTAAAISLTLMALLCAAFVLMCVRSFTAARRDRVAGFDALPPGGTGV